MTIDFNNKDAIKFDKLKLLASSVNDIPFKTQWNYRTTTGVINDEKCNSIRKKIRFNAYRISKRIRTVDVTKNTKYSNWQEQGN